MKTETKERDWVEEVGAPAYSAIAEMVAALQCDRDRMEELRDERDGFADEHEGDATEWTRANPDEAKELAELAAAVELDGEVVDEEAARERIQEDALSLEIYGKRVDGEWEVTGFELLLTTGGPAVRIMGELDEHSEPDRAWLEVQDWGKPWTQYIKADQETLLAYCRCFCFE